MEASILAVVLLVIVLLVIAVLVLAWLLVDRAESAASRDAERQVRDAADRRLLMRMVIAKNGQEYVAITNAEGRATGETLAEMMVRAEQEFPRDPETGEFIVPLGT